MLVYFVAEGGMVFGVPLGQCVENERLVRCGKVDPLRRDDSEELRRKSHHGSHSSFTSLVESASTSTKDQVRLYSAFHTLLNIGVRGCSSCLFSPCFILDVFMCPIPLIAEGSLFSFTGYSYNWQTVFDRGGSSRQLKNWDHPLYWAHHLWVRAYYCIRYYFILEKT